MSEFEKFEDELASKVSPTGMFQREEAALEAKGKTMFEPLSAVNIHTKDDSLNALATPLSASMPKRVGTIIPGAGSETTEEFLKKVTPLLERLGKAGAAGIVKARELLEKMKESKAHKDIDKLEKEIAELEETKKKVLLEAGLKEQKAKLESELNALKMPKLQEVTL